MEQGRVVRPEQPGVRRDRKDEGAAGAEHPGDLSYRTRIIIDVLEHVGCDHDVKAGRPERQVGPGRPA
jgi:hypothetical protein